MARDLTRLTPARQAVVLALLTLCLLQGFLATGALPAEASETAATGDADPGGVVLDAARLPRPTFSGLTDGTESELHAGPAVWIWNRGRLALQLVERTSNGGYRTLVATSLDTMREVGRVRLPRHVYGTSANSATTRHSAGAVDQEMGRLFLAYKHPRTLSPIGSIGDHSSSWNAEALSHGQVCNGEYACVAGVQIVDLGSMTVVGDIPLHALRVDGAVGSRLLAMEYAPPRAAGDTGKVLLFLQDAIFPEANGGTGPSTVKKSAGLYVNYVAQVDPTEQRQDWAVRVDACRSNRQPTETQTFVNYNHQPFPAVLMRSPNMVSPAIVAACHYGSAMGAAIVRIPLNAAGNPASLPVEVEDPSRGLYGAVASGDETRTPARVAEQQLATFGPEKTFQMIADPVGERVLLEVTDGTPLSKVWWVFDTAGWRFLGTIGIGPVAPGADSASIKGFDAAHGRLYHLMPQYRPPGGVSRPGGLFVVDVRRDPLSQALFFPQFEPLTVDTSRNQVDGGEFVLSTFAGDGLEPTRVFVPNGGGFQTATFFHVLADGLPRPEAAAADGDPFGRRTLDVDEGAGVTSSAFDGAARGYGARMLLVGGLESVPRVGPVDPFGQAYQCIESSQDSCNVLYNTTLGNAGGRAVAIYEPVNPCGRANRDVTLGFVGPVHANIVDASGARGGATPVAVDSGTRADAEAPASRCSKMDWDQVWRTGLFGRSPVAEPTVPWLFEEGLAECFAAEEPTSHTGDAVASRFAAHVDCSREEASGYAYARGMGDSGVNVGEALSSYRIYRDPGRGIVARVESVARGVTIPGVLRIDSVRGVAESWANGRRYHPPAPSEGAGGYDPNCDFERTAGTCFSRHIFGFWSPGYSCGPCGDEKSGLERMSRGMGAYGSVRLRDPDPVLARGADNGFIAAITKSDSERFGDLVLNNDLLQTVLPTLEIVRQAPPTRSLATGGPRGRQIIQLAGVEVGTSYGIACLLVYDEATNTCAPAEEEPGSITVSLADSGGRPLAGGAFEVRNDTDTDGLLGLKDTLLAGGACVTAEDGIGTCRFDGLAPGGYLVSQVAAPPGYAKNSEPFAVEVTAGEARTIAFTNVSNVSIVALQATDQHGAPLSGATFAAYPDPDADGNIAADTAPVGHCSTDTTGACTIKLPAGSYVLVQTAAPGGLAGIEPVAFTFASGGQTAAVAVVNYPPATPPQPDTAAAPIQYTPPVDTSPPIETVDDSYAPPTAPDPPVTAAPGVTGQVGGTITQVIRAPGDALRLLARDPQQAAAFTVALTLLALALIAIRRQQLLATLTATPALAFHRENPSDRPGGNRATTPVLERPAPAGAAPTVTDHVTAGVVAASASPTLSALIRSKLEPASQCDLLATASSFAELRGTLRDTTPDVLVIDLALAHDGPEDICQALAAIYPCERTVGLIPGGKGAHALALRAYTVGFAGLLVATDDLGNGQLCYAVRCVANGKPFYGSTVHSTLITHWNKRVLTNPVGLSNRELQVARLAAHGIRRTEIAQRLYLSPWTVKRHLASLRTKLGIVNPSDLGELRQRLRDFGLLNPAGEEGP